jgi:hypothetical protein
MSVPFPEWPSVRVIIRVQGNTSECMLGTAVEVESISLSDSWHVRFLLLALFLLLLRSTCYPTTLSLAKQCKCISYTVPILLPFLLSFVVHLLLLLAQSSHFAFIYVAYHLSGYSSGPIAIVTFYCHGIRKLYKSLSLYIETHNSRGNTSYYIEIIVLNLLVRANSP